MRRRKRRRTMRTDPDLAPPSTAPAPSAALPKLCVNGVCALQPGANPLPVPSAFSKSDIGRHLTLDSDALVVDYSGNDDSMKYASSVRADNPIPASGVAVYYFEVTVLEEGERGNIGLGICNGVVQLEKMPGWEGGSFGYHGDDGNVFKESGQNGIKYGPKYGTDDVVGCVWNFIDNTVSFTKNGEFLGKAFEHLSGPLYPTVGMQSKKGRLEINFGSKPFVFDIESYARQQRDRILSKIRARSLPADYRLLGNTVLGYLIHSGYAETAAAFAKDADRLEVMEKERSQMLERQAVCRKILVGDVDGAFHQLSMKFPTIVTPRSDIAFLLHTQKFIEMIVKGSNAEETIAYGRLELSVFRSPPGAGSSGQNSSEANSSDPIDVRKIDGVSYETILTEVWSLLAYSDPANCMNKHLTSQRRRDMVAGKLNAAILQSQGRPTRSVLENLVKHTSKVIQETLSVTNGRCALLTVDDFL